ncbi:MAG: hypothetical protein R3F39_19960 [Myxococcota bacterium]
MLSRAYILLVCCFALLLPFRARILFAEAVGWAMQFVYFTYYGTLNYILKELKKAAADNEGASPRVTDPEPEKIGGGSGA